MSRYRYRPSAADGWLAVASQEQLLAVHPQGVDAAVSVFAVVGTESGFQAALDELTRGGLSATPSFALLEFSGADLNSLRIIVRGGVRVVVTAGGTECTLDGTGVSTWTEQSFQQVSGFDIVVVPAIEEALAGERWLPLERGIALVSRIASADGSAAEGAAQAAAAQKSPSKQKTQATQPVTASAQRVPAPEAAPLQTKVSETTMADLPSGADSAAPKLASDARPTDAGYDYLFGETMYRNVSEAAVREPEAEPPPATEARGGDHDGMTIMTGDIKKLRGTRKSGTADAPAKPPATVLYLELSTGSRESLGQPLLVGRAPTASKVSGGALPRLVTIPGDKDISRNHAQFAVEGGTVVVTDLHSRNGTQVVMPGKSPQQLRQGEPTAVIVGTVVDLGGGVTLTVREEG